MSLRLPRAMYQPSAGAPPRAQWLTALCLAAILLTGWQFAELPDAPVRKYDPPVDMPWFGFGLMGVFVEADGKWVIHRTGYADRMKKYEITPDGSLLRSEETGVYDYNRDVSGGKGRGAMMPGGSVLNVKPSRDYYGWLQHIRAGGRDAVTFAQPGQAPLPTFGVPRSRDTQLPYVVLRVFKSDKVQLWGVLAGYHYYPVYDSVGYVAPHLWITTDRLRYLHLVYLTDAHGPVEVREERSLALDPGEPVTHDTSMGLDRHRGLVYVVLPNGERLWFKPATLEPAGRDQLPGVWAPEYASIGNYGQTYSFERGLPLTEGQYLLLMRSMVVALLASLLYLALHWRYAWKYIVEATTADSSLSGKSLPTSPA
jgi:hypothetical protein